MNLAVIGCSQGSMTVLIRTGVVYGQNWTGRDYAKIPVKLDLKERKKYTPGFTLLRGQYYELDGFGYWTKDGSYVPPSKSFRIRHKKAAKYNLQQRFCPSLLGRWV